MPLAPHTRIGPYEVIDRLGAGGMGEVYRVTDTRLGREAAMKLLLEQLAREPTAIERFMREARAASSLNHPNIVTIHEIGQSEHGLYIVMELVRGGPLRLPAGETMPCRTLVLLSRQIAEALAVAHAAGIVHRDIKPENILVRDDGYAKILDFGIARLLTPGFGDAKDHTLTAETGPGILLGSMRYMSPEQARGERVTQATDIFSLGIVIYELATGVHPFEAESPLSVLSAILTRQIIPPGRLNPEIPAEFDSLIQRMLDKDARLRPSAATCATSLAELAGGQVALVPVTTAVRPARHSVGRAKERDELDAAFGHVSKGSGLVVAIAGEPGIGKTTLVEDFLSHLAASERLCRIARGRCSDRLAGTGAYLPLLEALDALLHGRDGDTAAATMKLLAPTWYVQLARLPVDDESAMRLREDVSTGSQERLKRELGAFLREMSRGAPIVLAIEDIHWADLSTIDLLTYLGGMLDSLRLLVLATYRPSDLLLARHPFGGLKLKLQAKGICREIDLGFLTPHDVDLYLAMEFPEHRFPAELGALIHEKTEGSPLFMTELTRYLRDRHVVAQEGHAWVMARPIPDFADALPESIRGMIQRKIDTLTDFDRRLLLAGSVQGYDFDSAVVSKAMDADPVTVEERLDELERVLAFVRCSGEHELPGRTPNLRYRFVHILYQQALYNSLRAARRATLSAAVANAVETYHKLEPDEVASELALLFEAARDSSKAADYFLIAARHAARIFASNEAIALARHGLRVLDGVPPGPPRQLKELELLLVLTRPLINTGGYSSSEVEEACERLALYLCERLGQTPLLTPVLMGVWQVRISRGMMPEARELAERTMAAAQRNQDTLELHNAHATMGITFVCAGELAPGRVTLETAIRLLPEGFSRSRTLEYGQDTMSAAQLWRALALTFLGEYDEASDAERLGMSWASEVNHPFSLAYAFQLVARRRQLLRDTAGTLQFAEATMNLSQHRGFGQMLAVGGMYAAWAHAQQAAGREHVAALSEHLARYRRAGSGLQVPHYLELLAECAALNGNVDEALGLIDDGLTLARKDDARLYEGDLLRARGDLLRGRRAAESETAYREAIDAARRAGARLIEARSAAGLARLLIAQDRRDEADQLMTTMSALPGDEMRLLREA